MEANIEKLIEDNFKYLKKVCYKQGPDADELLSQSLLRMWTYRDSFTGNDVDFRKWAYVVIISIRNDKHRAARLGKRDVRKTVSLYREDDVLPQYDAISDTDIEAEYIQAESNKIKMRRLDKHLTEKNRPIVHKRLLGYSFEEIAQELRIPISTARTRMFHFSKRIAAVRLN